MKDTNLLTFAGLCLFGAMLTLPVSCKKQPVVVGELRCTIDGEVTLHEKNVKEAWATEWGIRIVYQNGNRSRYMPRPGEMCHWEEVR